MSWFEVDHGASENGPLASALLFPSVLAVGRGRGRCGRKQALNARGWNELNLHPAQSGTRGRHQKINTRPSGSGRELSFHVLE